LPIFYILCIPAVYCRLSNGYSAGTWLRYMIMTIIYNTIQWVNACHVTPNYTGTGFMKDMINNGIVTIINRLTFEATIHTIE